MPREEAEFSPRDLLSSILADMPLTKLMRLSKLTNPSTSRILVALLEDDDPI